MTKEKQGRASALPCFFMPDLPNKTAVMGHRTKRILRIERKEYQTY